MRRFTAILAILVLGLSLASTVSAGSPQGEGVRIMLSAEGAKAGGLSVRHRFGAKVSAHVTQGQLDGLKKRGIAYEVVPYVELEPEPGDSPFAVEIYKKGKSRSAVPVSQVPWGIKAIYGDPGLTRAGVSGGEGVVVAVLDTGMRHHVDFYRADGTSIIGDCIDFSDRKSDLVQGVCDDGHGHGTHVTGTIAAAGGKDGLGVYGVAPGATIYAYKVLTDKGGGYADDIARGIRAAADNGADILSMSFGNTIAVPVIQEAIQYAHAKGALLIAAVGNAGPTGDTIGYPAAFAEVVAVAGLNPDESVMAMSSRGTSVGGGTSMEEREIELSAPGSGVISTSYKGRYEYRSGTSMAAPHIAGLAAKLWAGDAATTRALLVTRANAHDITKAEAVEDAGSGWDIPSGYGMPQVEPLVQPLWND